MSSLLFLIKASCTVTVVKQASKQATVVAVAEHIKLYDASAYLFLECAPRVVVTAHNNTYVEHATVMDQEPGSRWRCVHASHSELTT